MGHSVSVWTVAFLECAGRYAFLRRADDRSRFPGLWTGVGGRVEADELADTHRAVLREIEEETGLRAGEVEDLRLRLTGLRAARGVEVLLFFSGRAARPAVVSPSVGVVEWRSPDDAPVADMIPTAALAWQAIQRLRGGTAVGVYARTDHGVTLTFSNGLTLSQSDAAAP